jgi:thiamine biosynthesis lipoprotein
VLSLTLAAADNPLQRKAPVLQEKEGGWIVRFDAMASPCEVLLSAMDREVAAHLGRLAATEAWRIERKFSRYLPDNPIAVLHGSHGQKVSIDPEMARMLSYADQCFAMSEGLFDITSGVLRRVWRFDGSDRLPAAESVQVMQSRVGWHKVQRGADWVILPEGMELDFGGIGKEYAVDRVLLVLVQALQTLQKSQTSASSEASGASGTMRQDSPGVLVNFGGDLVCSGPRSADQPWRVGIESIMAEQAALKTLQHWHGGLATSGDSRRFILHKGKRYSHILDPRTGWPVEGAPHSVTVAAATCTLSGMLATFAMLQGAGAEAFLQAQPGIQFWIQRQGMLTSH